MRRPAMGLQPYATDAGLAGITGSPTRTGGPDRRAAAARRMGLMGLCRTVFAQVPADLREGPQRAAQRGRIRAPHGRAAPLLAHEGRRGALRGDDGRRERRDLFLGQGAHGLVHLHADGRAAALRRVHPPHRRDVQGAVTVARGAAPDPRGDRRATKGDRAACALHSPQLRLPARNPA